MNHKLNIELPENLEIYREKIEATIKPYIQIQLTESSNPDWWQSKFGGLPYLPKNYEYPKNSQGQYLYLLAQINFEQTPKLEGFPNRGILQFYILPNETYGMIFLDTIEESILPNTQQDSFRVIYFPEISLNTDDVVTDFSFLPTRENQDCYFPINGCCAIDFSYQTSPISFRDYQFNIFSADELDDNYEQLDDEYYESFPNDGHKIGGYPDFTQEDPRYYLEEDVESPYILLFQMDSDWNDVINILWGDTGIGNFFIKKSALQKLDFSEVLYNWDCG